MYISRVYLAFSKVYPTLCVWCVCVCVCADDRWATLPTSVVMTALVLWPWAHVSVKEGERDGRD
jgi:hypothetical protein